MDVDALRGSTLDIPEHAVAPLPEGSHYRFQLLGLTAVTDAGKVLGTVADVLETGSSDVFVIRSNQGREALVPNVLGISDVNVSEGRLLVHPIPGLLDDLDGSDEPSESIEG